MNRERAKELLPIIQAFAEGKEVQYKQTNAVWIDCREADFGMGFTRGTEYRIKPEPREFWIRKRPMEDMVLYTTEPNFTDPDTELIHVREVIE